MAADHSNPRKDSRWKPPCQATWPVLLAVAVPAMLLLLSTGQLDACRYFMKDTVAVPPIFGPMCPECCYIKLPAFCCLPGPYNCTQLCSCQYKEALNLFPHLIPVVKISKDCCKGRK